MENDRLALVLEREPRAVFRRIGGEDYVRLGADAFLLEGVGFELWRRLDGIRSLRDLARDVAEEFGANGDEVSADLIEFSDELMKLGLARPIET